MRLQGAHLADATHQLAEYGTIFQEENSGPPIEFVLARQDTASTDLAGVPVEFYLQMLRGVESAISAHDSIEDQARKRADIREQAGFRCVHMTTLLSDQFVGCIDASGAALSGPYRPKI
jgi:hypothetical protein